MATVTIRNKKTGETKVVPAEQLQNYGIQQAGQSAQMQSPQMPQPPANQVSGTPSTVGMMAGGIAGTPFGPVGRMVGAGVGAGIGQEVAQFQAGQPGDPGALLPVLGPGANMLRILQKGSKGQIGPDAQQSPTEKAMQTGVASQATGEAASMVFKVLLQPVKFFGDMVDELSKKANKTLNGPVIKDRLFNEVLPEIIKKRQMEVPTMQAADQIVNAEPDLFSARGGYLGRWFSADELNNYRKKFNLYYKDSPQLMNDIKYGIAKIIKEEQIKLAPSIKTPIAIEHGLLQGEKLIKSIPSGIGKFLLKATQLFTKPVSNAGSALSKYALPGLIKSVSEQR